MTEHKIEIDAPVQDAKMKFNISLMRGWKSFLARLITSPTACSDFDAVVHFIPSNTFPGNLDALVSLRYYDMSNTCDLSYHFDLLGEVNNRSSHPSAFWMVFMLNSFGKRYSDFANENTERVFGF